MIRDEFTATGHIDANSPEFLKAKEYATELARVMEKAEGQPNEVLAGTLYVFLAAMCMRCSLKGREEAWLKSIAFGTYILMEKNGMLAEGRTLQ